MTTIDADWDKRVTAAWATFDDYAEAQEADFRAVIDALVAELPADSPVGPFERACAWDSTGHSDRAVPLYREALARGLDGYRGRARRSSSPARCGTPDSRRRASSC